MNAIFTIVAKNYIGLAQVLGQSIQKHGKVDFFIFVADEFEEKDLVNISLPENVLIAKKCLNFENNKWNELSFKYNLVEFCTSIKPACFQYLFNQKGYRHIIFSDPDVFFFNSTDQIFSQLTNCSILLTPHLLSLQTPFKGDYPDHLFLLNGTFNLGFIGLTASKSTDSFLAWWHHRLLTDCFFDNDKGMATDQKWINMVPSFFSPSELHISFNYGMNVAPWNFHERKIVQKNNEWLVADREDEKKINTLIFVHFSGYDYVGFSNKRILHKNSQATNYEDYNPLFEIYGQAIHDSEFKVFHPFVYSYNCFKNGINILSLHRRIFRKLLLEGQSYPNPFDYHAGSYFDQLEKKKLIDYSKLVADKITNKTIRGFDAKIKWVNLLFTIIQKCLGVKRYSIMIRFFKRYFSEENQVFLFDNKLGNKF